MATYNGLVKLGTLRNNTTIKPRPTKPWQSNAEPNQPEPYAGCGLGNIPNFSSDPTMTNWNIGNTDTTEANQLHWHKITDGTKTLLICDRVILVGVSWDDLNFDNRVFGKKITIDGLPYKLRLLSGGTGTGCGPTNANEWERFVRGVEVIAGIPIKTSSDEDSTLHSADKTSTHNQFWNWMGVYSWVQERTEYRWACGNKAPCNRELKESSLRDSRYGWRPVLEVLNAALTYNGLVKLGTLRNNTTIKPRPTHPWRPYSEPYTGCGLGNIPNFSSDPTITNWNIGNTDATEANQLWWHKITDGTKTLLVCDRVILVGVSWNDLNADNRIFGKNITIDGRQYKLRLLSGGVRWAAWRCGSSDANEWDRFVTNEEFINGIPTATWSELDSTLNNTDKTSTHNKFWNWMGVKSLVQEKFTEGDYEYSVNRGGDFACKFDLDYTSRPESYIGWRPVLEVLNAAPLTPSYLNPAGSSSSPTKVPTLTPNISWRFTDPDLGDTQSAYQVIIKEGARVVKNSEKVPSRTNSYTVPANTLRSNTLYNYTVKVWDQADLPSPDSPSQYFIIVQAPTAEPLEPKGTSTAPARVSTLTPVIRWKFTDPDPSDTQSACQVIIKEGARVVKNSEKIPSGTNSYTVPANTLRSNTLYNYTVKVWDQADLPSPDSPSQYFIIVQAPTAEPLEPKGTSTAPAKLSTLTPAIRWKFADPDLGDRQSAYQVIIKEGAHVVKNSEKVPSGTNSYYVPSNTLRSNTLYNYTVKVWDQADLPSHDSPSQYFEIVQAPNAPIDLNPAGPSTNPVKVPTLTPTITWRFTDPDGDRQGAYQVIIREGAVEVDNSGKVTNSTSSYTVPANKLRSNTIYNYTVKVWDQTDEASRDSAAWYFQTRQAPNAPVDLNPAGPSTNPVKVPTLTPTITWRFTDPDGDRQGAYQVIIREGAVEVDNSGKITNSTSSYTVPANKLRSNTTYNYTVKVWDQTGEVSQDSAAWYFQTRKAPTAEPKYPLGPSANPVSVPTLTPTIKWRYIDLEGLAQEKFQVKIYNAEDDHIVHDTGEILSDSDDFDYVVPAGKLTAGKTYYWTIQVWNINTNSDVTEPQYFKTS